MDMHLEKLLKQHQQIDSTSQKILEVNPDHPLIKDLLKILKRYFKVSYKFVDLGDINSKYYAIYLKQN